MQSDELLSDSLVSLNELFSSTHLKFENKTFIDGVSSNPVHPIVWTIQDAIILANQVSALRKLKDQC